MTTQVRECVTKQIDGIHIRWDVHGIPYNKGHSLQTRGWEWIKAFDGMPGTWSTTNPTEGAFAEKCFPLAYVWDNGKLIDYREADNAQV